MKKIIVFACLLLFPLFFASSVLAQEKNSNEYYQEFLSKYRLYQSKVEPFNAKKSRFLTFRTVETQAEFLESAKDFLSSELAAIESYSNFIRSYLVEVTSILNYQENYLFIKLDDELTYCGLTKEKIKNLSSLEQTISLFSELKTHYEKIKGMGWQVKSIVSLASAEKVLNNLKVEGEKIDAFIGGVNESNPRLDAAKDKFNLSKKKTAEMETLLAQGKNILNNMKEGGGNEENFGQVQKIVVDLMAKERQQVSNYQDITLNLK